MEGIERAGVELRAVVVGGTDRAGVELGTITDDEATGNTVRWERIITCHKHTVNTYEQAYIGILILHHLSESSHWC